MKNKKTHLIITGIKESFHSKKFKNGAYSTLIMVVSIIAILLVNLIFNELDLKVDVSSEKMFTLTDESKDIIGGLQDKITLYYICEEGQEAQEVEQLLNKYVNLSSNIQVVQKDPALYPTFTSQYVDSGTTVYDNSVIVVDETNERYKYVSVDDMIVTQMNYSTYQSEATALDIEGQITSAIQTVTSDNAIKMYTVTGHGEATISSSLTKEIQKKSVSVESLNTRTVDKIPEDCNILMMYGPTTDYSEEEVTRIKEYLVNGGKAMIFLNYDNKGMTNFNALLEYYGMQVVEGIVLEDKDHSISGYVNNILAVTGSHDLTQGISDSKNPVLLVNALAMKEIDTRSTVTKTPILTSSENSYAKMNLYSDTLSKEEGDVDGPFDTGVLVSETYDNVTSELLVFSSYYMLDETYTTTTACGNLDLILNGVSYFGGTETGLSIPARSLQSTSLVVSSTSTIYATILLVILLPIALLTVGFVIWYRRRRR